MVYDTAQTTSMPKMTIKMPYHCSRAVVFAGLPTNQIRPKSTRVEITVASRVRATSYQQATV